MEYKFIDTHESLKIGPHEFCLDIGEIAVGEAATEVIKACLDENKNIEEIMANTKKALDRLLGEGASEKILEGRTSSTNEVQLRHVALWAAHQVNRRRAEMVLSAFAPAKAPEGGETTEKAGNQGLQ